MDHSARRRPLLLPLLAALSLSLGACGGSSSSALSPTTTTTTTTTSTALVTETFTGSIGQNGTAIHPFTVKVDGYTLLAGFTGLTPASQASLGMGIGSWDGTTSTCSLNLAQNDAAKSGSTALTATATAANYCMRVYDGGNIAAGVTVGYTLQVQHY
jgi:hypothetical protein